MARRVLPALSITKPERARLGEWTRRPTTAQALALRARIILAADRGLSNQQVAAELGIHQVTVGKWRERFVQKRLDGLLDEPRPGAPRRIGDDQVERVVALTLESKPVAATHWSTRDMGTPGGYLR